MASFRFTLQTPKPWTGRYARIPGDTTALHVLADSRGSRIAVYWRRDDETGTCSVVECEQSRRLAAAVAHAKRAMGGSGHGAFQINEYGQVIVPSSSGGYSRMLVGEVEGDLRFLNPFQDGQAFTLGDDAGLSTGDSWEGPYLGMPYNLSGRSEIYFWRMDEDGGRKELPRAQDRTLIAALRRIRRSGAMRFIVNPARLVLTKRPPGGEWQGPDETWETVYVGRLDCSKWFKKES